MHAHPERHSPTCARRPASADFSFSPGPPGGGLEEPSRRSASVLLPWTSDFSEYHARFPCQCWIYGWVSRLRRPTASTPISTDILFWKQSWKDSGQCHHSTFCRLTSLATAFLHPLTVRFSWCFLCTECSIVLANLDFASALIANCNRAAHPMTSALSGAALERIRAVDRP